MAEPLQIDALGAAALESTLAVLRHLELGPFFTELTIDRNQNWSSEPFNDAPLYWVGAQPASGQFVHSKNIIVLTNRGDASTIERVITWTGDPAIKIPRFKDPQLFFECTFGKNGITAKRLLEQPF